MATHDNKLPANSGQIESLADPKSAAVLPKYHDRIDDYNFISTITSAELKTEHFWSALESLLLNTPSSLLLENVTHYINI